MAKRIEKVAKAAKVNLVNSSNMYIRKMAKDAEGYKYLTKAQAEQCRRHGIPVYALDVYDKSAIAYNDQKAAEEAKAKARERRLAKKMEKAEKAERTLIPYVGEPAYEMPKPTLKEATEITVTLTDGTDTWKAKFASREEFNKWLKFMDSCDEDVHETED